MNDNVRAILEDIVQRHDQFGVVIIDEDAIEELRSFLTLGLSGGGDSRTGAEITVMNIGIHYGNHPVAGDTIRFTHDGLRCHGEDGARVWVVGVFESMSSECPYGDSQIEVNARITPLRLEGTEESIEDFFGVFLEEDGTIQFLNVSDQDFNWETIS